jgi:hypothetical protein
VSGVEADRRRGGDVNEDGIGSGPAKFVLPGMSAGSYGIGGGACVRVCGGCRKGIGYDVGAIKNAQDGVLSSDIGGDLRHSPVAVELGAIDSESQRTTKYTIAATTSRMACPFSLFSHRAPKTQ